jgi:hypothetical protein
VQFPLPPLDASTSLASFVVIAVAMVLVTIVVFGLALPANGRPPLISQLTLALAVIGGGSVLLLALVFVFISTNGTSAWTFVLLAFNFMMMGPAGLWFIGLVVFRDRRVGPTDWLWPVALAIMTTGSEVLMGFLFALGGEAVALPVVPTLAMGLSSVWYFWSMASIMAALVVWAPLARVERYGLVALTISAVLGPWVTSFPVVGGLAMAVLMGAIFGFLVLAVSGRGTVRPHQIGFLIGLAVAFLAMTFAGLALVATGGAVGAVLAYGAVAGVVMTVEIAGLIRRYWVGSGETPWVRRHPADDEPPVPVPPTASSGAALPARPIPEAHRAEAVVAGDP